MRGKGLFSGQTTIETKERPKVKGEEVMSNYVRMEPNEIYIGDNYTIMNSEKFKKYKKKIKMIYIDPPYNTQKKKSYNDNKNSVEWKSFMRKRLYLAREFLKEEGSIFISIDDNEYANLKLLCDEIFGKENFVGTFITFQAQRSNAKHINTVHEYVVCYSKNKKKLPQFKINRMEIPEERLMINKLYKEIRKIFNDEGFESANQKIKKIIKDYCMKYNITWLRNYSNVDKDGKIFFAVDLSTPGKPRKVSIEEIGLQLDPLPTRGWTSDNKFIELYNKNLLCYKDGRPYSKLFLEDSRDNVPSIIRFYSRQGTNDLKKLGISNLFDTPKPVDLIKFLIRISTNENDIIMDFFAGSGTTAQAVYELNKENNRRNNYILIQIPEEVDKNSDAFKSCIKHKINPDFASIMIYRINVFLKKYKIEKDFVIWEG